MNLHQKEIKTQIQNFCLEHLDKEQSDFAVFLLQVIIEDPVLNINRGKSQIWAASIIYVIARLNFSFDKNSESYITVDQLCYFFDTVKSTAGNKATQIEKAYNIRLGDQDFCKAEIYESFQFHTTEEGFIIPASMMNSKEIEFENMTPEEEAEINRYLQEKQQKHQTEIKEKEEKRRSEARLKKTNPNQIDLFGA